MKVVVNPAYSRGVRAYAIGPDHAKALWLRSKDLVAEVF